MQSKRPLLVIQITTVLQQAVQLAAADAKLEGTGITFQLLQLTLLCFLGVFGLSDLCLTSGEFGFFFFNLVVGRVIPPWKMGR